jgi:hypothetical protein
VFIEIAPYVRVEIFQQLLNGSETIRVFGSAAMPMIAFPRLIVIAQHALEAIDQGQTIFVAVLTGWYAPRQSPNADLGEGVRPQSLAPPQQCRLRVRPMTAVRGVVNQSNSAD